MGLTDKQKVKMNKLNLKRKEKILKATNNGRCWWVYQQLIANPRQSRKTR